MAGCSASLVNHNAILLLLQYVSCHFADMELPKDERAADRSGSVAGQIGDDAKANGIRHVR